MDNMTDFQIFDLIRNDLKKFMQHLDKAQESCEKFSKKIDSIVDKLGQLSHPEVADLHEHEEESITNLDSIVEDELCDADSDFVKRPCDESPRDFGVEDPSDIIDGCSASCINEEQLDVIGIESTRTVISVPLEEYDPFWSAMLDYGVEARQLILIRSAISDNCCMFSRLVYDFELPLMPYCGSSIVVKMIRDYDGFNGPGSFQGRERDALTSTRLSSLSSVNEDGVNEDGELLLKDPPRACTSSLITLGSDSFVTERSKVTIDTRWDTSALNLGKDLLKLGKFGALKLLEESFDACRDLVFEVTSGPVAAIHQNDALESTMLWSNPSTKKSTHHNILGLDTSTKFILFMETSDELQKDLGLSKSILNAPYPHDWTLEDRDTALLGIGAAYNFLFSDYGWSFMRNYDGFNGPGSYEDSFNFGLALIRDYDGFNGPGHTLRTRCL